MVDHIRMSSSKSTKESSKRRNTPGNRSDVGWEHGIDVDGNGKKVKCKYCSKVISGGILDLRITWLVRVKM